MIYLDSAATTQIAPEVFEAMEPWIRSDFYNAGTTYSGGRLAKQAVEDARLKLARMFNSTPEHIIFTSGGSEGNSFSFLSAAKRLKRTGKNHILVSSVEHDSVKNAAKALITDGFDVEFLPVCRGGSVKIEALQQAIRPDTGLVSVMYVNNETGAVNLIEQISELCSSRGILFHSDCVQAAGLLPLDSERISFDYATISAHKFHGPKGIGCVYVRNPEKETPLIWGGQEQELGLRGGTENVPAIVGAGVAAELLYERISEIQEVLWSHRIHFWERVAGSLGTVVRFNGQWMAPSKVINITVSGVDADTLVLLLDANGVCVSAGSACRSHEQKPSETLLAMGLTPEEARSSVRISFSELNTTEELSQASDIFIRCVCILKEV